MSEQSKVIKFESGNIDEMLRWYAPSVKNKFVDPDVEESFDREKKETALALEQIANSQLTIDNTAQKIIDSSKIGKVDYNNPLADWSAEVVDIELSPTRPNQTTTLRQRIVDKMHGHARKEETVASLKIVKENTDIQKDINDNFREFFTRAANRIPSGALEQTDVLFETTNFMLQVIGESDTEKYQIIDSFGKPQIFMFGRRYRVYSYSGTLWNDQCNNWKDEFKYIYNKYLRGTSCVENGIKIVLTYDRSVRLGYLLSMTINQSSDVEMAVPVNFSMFVEDEKELLDAELLDPGGSDVSQDMFNLVRAQQASVNKEKNLRERAINKKLEIDTTPATPSVKPSSKPIKKAEVRLSPTTGPGPSREFSKAAGLKTMEIYPAPSLAEAAEKEKNAGGRAAFGGKFGGNTRQNQLKYHVDQIITKEDLDRRDAQSFFNQ